MSCNKNHYTFWCVTTLQWQRGYGKCNHQTRRTESMDDYKERFELYCTANGIAEGAEYAPRRKAIFLTAVGATTYSLLKNLVRPRQPQELTLEAIIKELKDHYEPKKIVIAERFRFYKRPQKEGESIAVYLAELRRLAKYCDFGDYLSTQWRIQPGAPGARAPRQLADRV